MRIGIGRTETVDVAPPASTDVWEFRPDRGRPLLDVRVAASQAVAAPEDFPSLAQAIVDGDDVALAVDANCPDVAAVILGVLDSLPLETLGSVTVVLSDEAIPETVDEVRRALERHPQIVVEVHKPDDRAAVGYLAANAAADPIYLNRHLLDADLVIPVVTARPTGSLDPASMDGAGLFPSFTDINTQQRLRVETLEAAGVDDREAAEAAWLLGVQFLVAVIPTAEAQVARVLAGTPRGIRRVAEHLIEASWRRDVTRKASLVVACLDGGRQQQSWDNVARALHVARHLVRPGGTIVVTSQMSQSVGRSLRRLAGTDTYERMRERIAKDKTREALVASLLLQLRQEGRVLLLSQLPGEEIESLGIGAVENIDQLLKLIEGHESCAIIRSAQFCGIGTG